VIAVPHLPREIAPGVFWLGGCLGVELDGRIVHGYSSVYLLRGTKATLLVDPGHPMDWHAIDSGLDDLLGARPLDYVLPTHPEMPHSGNLGRLLAKYPDAQAVGDLRDFHLYYPGFVAQFATRPVGDVIDLGDMQFEIVDALIKDLPNSVWGYESTRRILYVADGFAYLHHPELGEGEHGPYHLPGECYSTVRELGQLPTLRAASWFTGFSLYWSRYTDNADAIFEQVRSLIATHPTDIIAPAHGSVIDDVPGMVGLMVEAHKSAFIR